ncbi:hypothetical protein E2562_019351 [Oryza meyeriana var. granulata]|uniref:Uncharacterized protein n=1 Tax=Oryza meyeriana var. granulata TaxID=110450 RepID=A0A6G1BLQ2_9ORYZ|nr:hypothetical protein E2562_019351 [Oryza meyeriana var. granulata]
MFSKRRRDGGVWPIDALVVASLSDATLIAGQVHDLVWVAGGGSSAARWRRRWQHRSEGSTVMTAAVGRLQARVDAAHPFGVDARLKRLSHAKGCGGRGAPALASCHAKEV